jgi:membrane-bound lytic murein transglycosylase B
MRRFACLTTLAALLLTLLPEICLAQDQTEPMPPKEWLSFLDRLKQEMISKGISEATVEKAYGNNTYYHVRPAVVEQDKKQAEFILTAPTYLNKLVTADRVSTARKQYKKLAKKYGPIEEKYGVPLAYLTAFWAIETNFGQNKGKYHLIDSLTNLSYHNRRSDFFKKELYNVLSIMDRFDLSNDKMMGSWAGAMGHFQFMPSTYNAYAVDYDGDNVIDIWDSFDDALASAANYLNALGWKADQSWGEKAALPWNFDYHLTGARTTKTIAEWKKLGVKTADHKPLPYDDALKASVIMPDGRKGPVYIALSNFRRIMIWNRSENYALAVGLLADYITSDQKYVPQKAETQYPLTDREVMTVQHFANKILKLDLKEDGKLGPKTKDAVKKLQQKAKMPADGYPDDRLLTKIAAYDPKLGFSAPVPPTRPKKASKK